MIIPGTRDDRQWLFRATHATPPPSPGRGSLTYACPIVLLSLIFWSREVFPSLENPLMSDCRDVIRLEFVFQLPSSISLIIHALSSYSPTHLTTCWLAIILAICLTEPYRIGISDNVLVSLMASTETLRQKLRNKQPQPFLAIAVMKLFVTWPCVCREDNYYTAYT